jgi:DNA-damage-inducible protein D
VQIRLILKWGRKFARPFKELGGAMPESLPTPEQSVKQVESAKKNMAKK